MHIRQQVIERVETLVTGLTSTGTRVTRQPVYDVETTDLPCLRVRFGPERLEPVSMPAPRLFERVCVIDVIGLARATEDLDEALSTIAAEVETALASPVSGPWKQLTLSSLSQEESGDGAKPIGAITLRYEAMYRVRENAPDTAA